jgi:hypothetical protein
MGEPLVPGRFAGGATVPYDEDVLFDAINEMRDAGAYGTTAAVTLYVSTTGNDTTGDGSVGAPFATVNKAYSTLPKFINHDCRIMVEAGDYPSGFPESIAPIFGENGSLLITGVGAPTAVMSGLAVTGVTDLGENVQRVAIGAGGLGADDSLCGQFLHITAGTSPGYCVLIAANTDNSIDVIHSSKMVVNGDTVSTITPAVKVVGTKTKIQAINLGAHAHDDANVLFRSRVSIQNIWLNFDGSAFSHGVFTVEDCDILLEFVRISTNYGWYTPIRFKNANHRTQSTFYSTNEHLALAMTGLVNGTGHEKIGFSVVWNHARDSHRMLACIGDCEISQVAMLGCLYLLGARITTSHSAMGNVESYDSSVSLNAAFIVGTAGINGFYALNTGIQLYSVYFEHGNYAVELRNSCSGGFEKCSCSATNIAQSAINANVLTQIRIKGAHADFLGANAARAAYVFVAPSVDIEGAAWPANGAGATDSMGSWIVRVD